MQNYILKGDYPIIFASNVFHNSHLIQKCIQNQQLLLILYTLLRFVKNIRHKDDRMNSLWTKLTKTLYFCSQKCVAPILYGCTIFSHDQILPYLLRFPLSIALCIFYAFFAIKFPFCCSVIEHQILMHKCKVQYQNSMPKSAS